MILASVLADVRSIVARVSTAWAHACGSMHALRRRRLRAVAQEILPLEGQAGFDYVMIGRVHTALRPWSRLKSDLRSALRALHENAPENVENA